METKRPSLGPQRTSSNSSLSSSPSISSPLSQNTTADSEIMSRRAGGGSHSAESSVTSAGLDLKDDSKEADLERFRSEHRLTGNKATGIDRRLSPAASISGLSEHFNNNSIGLPPPNSSSSSLPITISTNLSSNISTSNLKFLSTTPLFPSPLAQASGPDEDGEYFRGEAEGTESEEEKQDPRRRTATIEDSPLRREMPALFGDPEISPTIGTILLPGENSLGLGPLSATPRRSSRDASPEDSNRTARAVRVRSIGRAGGLGFSDESGLARRRSRASDIGEKGTNFAAMITPRKLAAISTSPPSNSPPSPTHSSPSTTSPISRRQSVHILSPSRSHAPLSPSASRAPRSSLSAAMAAPMPFPAPPPPNDAIKRQRVPDSVRSAMDFRLPSGPSFIADSLVAPGPGTTPALEVALPKTPMGTRAPSPVSGSNSGSNSEAHRSPGPSKPSSQSSSRRGSTDKVFSVPLVSPVFIPGHASTISASSSSAFSPLFPFPSSPTSSSSPRTRDRSRSVYNASSTSNLQQSPDFKNSFPSTSKSKQHDLGVSPLTLGLSPMSLGTVRVSSEGTNEMTNAQRQGRGVLAANRTSSIPPGVTTVPASTDEYARIILASRNAKMRKWKSSTATNDVNFDAIGNWSKDDFFSRASIPNFGEEDEQEELIEYSKANKEIEWVDWLDEYRKMKEAKLRAESDTRRSSRPATADAKGKGRISNSSYEHNPFEATTAGMNLRKTTGFDTEVTTYQPSTNSSPISVPPLTSRSTAPLLNSLSRSISASYTTNGSISSGVSPPTKRKRNFKLGTKIDAWWSAVRTSFSTGAEEERGSTRERGPSLPNALGFKAPIHIERTPSLVPLRQTLRNATSAQDLSPFKSSRVPSGASAVAAASISETVSVRSDGSDLSKSDSRWRNPNLSLNLGPSFSTLSLVEKATQVPVNVPPLPRNLSHSTSEAFPSSRFSSPPLPMSSASHALPSDLMTPSGFTPAPQTPWDRTPSYLSQADAIFPIRARPKSAKEVKSAGLSGFSMDSVRQHIKLRLTTAKENCDKELSKIVLGITAHVEVELERNDPSETPFDDGNFAELEGDGFSGTFDMDSESEAPLDEENLHTDSEGGTSRPPSRSQSLSAPGATIESSLMGRRGSNSKVRPDSPRRMSLAPRSRHVTSLPRQGDFLSGHGPPRESNSTPDSISASSSRSNSRNRSPLPPALRNISAAGSRSPARSSTSHIPLAVDLAQSEFILLLQEIITVATEILDTPITTFITNPGCCAEYIQRVQRIGKAWDENAELSGRGWYVQLLLAVAGLSRVVEWWEAEKGFWTFDDSDEGDAEPISFVAKPTLLENYQKSSTVSEYGASQLLSATSSKYSPLGIDLGTSEETKSETAGDIVRDANDFRLTVDQVRSQTLLMELSLDGQLFQYLSSAWEDLVGLDAGECLDSSIAEFLYPDDAAVFAEATRQLEADDSHTVEVRFRLRVATSSATSNDEAGAEELYEVMEGKGMLMMDGLGGGPSHTMWVVRPAPLGTSVDGDETKDELFGNYGRDSFKRGSVIELSPQFIPVTRTMAEPILCRICDRPTPAWFFEKHNETCNETHRLEHDIVECNDGLKELARTVEEISLALDQRDAASPAEYRGITLLSPTPTPTPPTPLEGLRYPLFPKSNLVPARKAQYRILDQVADIVSTALDISTPSVLEEVDSFPIENQRLLSPNSENKLALVMRWQRPPTEEPALVYLVSDTEERIRFKLNTVNRLRNTILYAEKVRQEWEAKAGAALASVQEDTPFASPMLQPVPTSQNIDQMVDPLDLVSGTTPTPLRSRNSHMFDAFTPPISPLIGPDDTMRNPFNTVSPRLPTGVPSSRTKSSSIKDFKMLKPISKGAFGSVYLAKKITTGDYYAIKVLKKSDMIAKNQVTNVKAERLILMTQSESDFVVKLYYTFQDKDYLYLVMEYLNGGDCAALVKNMGELPEDWTRRYIAEVVVGLEYLHSSGIIHRDLKPDNLLIDAKGHLKLTDFGLSRIGLLGRQTTMPISMRDRRYFDSSLRSNSTDAGVSNNSSPSSTPLNAVGASQASYFGSLLATDSFSLDTPHSESSGSESLRTMHRGIAAAIDTLASSRPASGPVSRAVSTAGQKFVGTPDYLAPESILGIGMDVGVDWWALGVICYEFLYGFPPFHDETPEKVFENILSRKIEWHEDEVEISPEARDFMERLMCSDSFRRLGINGSEEVKSHPFLADIEWNNLLAGDVDFVPKVSDPESTDYFDSRGAVAQVFDEAEVSPPPLSVHATSDSVVETSTLPSERRAPRERSETAPVPQDDFGTFNFRNLPILKQANDKVIRKLRDEQLKLGASTGIEAVIPSNRILSRKLRTQSLEFGSMTFTASPSETSGSSSSGSRVVSGPNTPFASNDLSKRNVQQPPPLGIRSTHIRRNSMPTRLRAGSMTDLDTPVVSEAWSKNIQRRRASGFNVGTPGSDGSGAAMSSVMTPPPGVSPHATHPPGRVRTIDCLVAGKNPITNKVLETMLVRLGCRCVVVPDGGEAILAANSVQFDIIWMDLQMWPISGEKAARYIKSTRSASAQSSIVAVCSYGTAVDDDVGTLFSAVLPKPIMKENLLSVLRKLRFTEKQQTRRGSGDILTRFVGIGEEGEERRGSS